MRTPQRAVQASLIVAVLSGFVVGLACLLTRSREPVYEGEGLRFWLKTVHTRGFIVPGAEPEVAIRQIGTNALPLLLQMISTRDEGPQAKKLLEKLSLQSRLKYHLLTADDTRWDGNGGFLVLGGAAAPAVPALIDLLDHDSSAEIRIHTAIALSRIGPSASEAIPALMRHLSNDTDSIVRSYADIALKAIDPGAPAKTGVK